MSAVARQMKAIADRARLMIGRAVIAAVDDAQRAQALQLDLLADETQDGVERFQEYGFTSHPHPGAEAITAFVGGLRSHGVVIAVEDRRYRLKGLAEGEVALYDDQGQMVKLGRDAITISTPKDISIEGVKVTVIAAQAEVRADRVDLGSAGGAKVARIGDSVAGGVITSGSAKVFAA